MPITAFYAAMLAALYIVLSARVIVHRRAQKIEIGDGSDRELLRRVRVHANFIEYTPLFLILLGLAESLAVSRTFLLVVGGAFGIGRLLHAYGLSQTPHILKLRVAGMVLSLLAIAGAAMQCLVHALARGLV